MIVLIVLGFLASSMVYTVAIDEVGVIQRFGKYVRTEQPGLILNCPPASKR